jgi:acyl-[acyl-carrier-protein]-phospholipid O-acyltransferase/long-chain-fatty-acid--[acyl-carrier-protein] ligase
VSEPGQEATLLFTSGSSGNPKGVVLSHQNLLSNCRQIESVQLFASQSYLLANLPLFHSFGFTVSMLYTMLSDLVMVCLPSPLDVKKSLEVIKREKVEVLLGTPTFLRGYLRKAKKEQLESIRFVVAGAEKTPDGFKEDWESLCPCSYLEGYGLTEASPAISFNLPDQGMREKSVGRLLPDIQGKTISPETSEALPTGEVGILCFLGPNIFSGYLDDDQADSTAFDDQGWYITGDLGRIDPDGFLFIEGRLSRFSKIGGEMVPHTKVENVICEIFFPDGSDQVNCAVVGLPDPVKGEKLILLTTEDFEIQDVRKKLVAKGIPNLWIPKASKKVPEIPILASGKLDLSELKRLGLSSN